MPLVPGKSKSAISQNIKTEMNNNRPQQQAIAIALQKARDAGKTAPTINPNEEHMSKNLRIKK